MKLVLTAHFITKTTVLLVPLIAYCLLIKGFLNVLIAAQQSIFLQILYKKSVETAFQIAFNAVLQMIGKNALNVRIRFTCLRIRVALHLVQAITTTPLRILMEIDYVVSAMKHACVAMAGIL